MTNTRWLIFFLLATALCAGCAEETDDETGTGPSLVVKGADLLGLTDGRTLEYLVSDTFIVWFPGYHLETDTGTQVVSISGGGNDWVINDSSTPLINLKVSDPLVLHNGYWRKVGESDAQVWFPVPAIAMDRSAARNESWSGYVPVYTTDSGQLSFMFYYGYFGFHFTKTFAGQQEVLVSAFGGPAYRYEVNLFKHPGDPTPLATVVEDYVPNIGLVRQEMRAQGWTRVLSLKSYY